MRAEDRQRIQDDVVTRVVGRHVTRDRGSQDTHRGTGVGRAVETADRDTNGLDYIVLLYYYTYTV